MAILTAILFTGGGVDEMLSAAREAVCRQHRAASVTVDNGHIGKAREIALGTSCKGGVNFNARDLARRADEISHDGCVVTRADADMNNVLTRSNCRACDPFGVT